MGKYYAKPHFGEFHAAMLLAQAKLTYMRDAKRLYIRAAGFLPTIVHDWWASYGTHTHVNVYGGHDVMQLDIKSFRGHRDLTDVLSKQVASVFNNKYIQQTWFDESAKFDKKTLDNIVRRSKLNRDYPHE